MDGPAAISAWFWRRGAAILALALPCLSGLAYLTAFDAPRSYVMVNAGALALGLGWIGFGPALGGMKQRRILVAVLLALMAMPLVFGPAANGVTRWIAIGPAVIHIGMAVIPLIVCLAAKDRDYAPVMVLAAMFIALLQPDAASGFALMLAAVGLYFARGDWRPGVVAIAGFAAAVLANVRGELPAQPFVERFLADLILVHPALALGLALSLLASFFLILRAVPLDQAERYALAGSFAGFSIAALFSNYPHILIGYGAAPIMGYALALGPRAQSKLLHRGDKG